MIAAVTAPENRQLTENLIQVQLINFKRSNQRGRTLMWLKFRMSIRHEMFCVLLFGAFKLVI